MCQKRKAEGRRQKAEGKKQDEIDELLENINDVFLALQNIRVNDPESRQLRQDALVSTIIIRASLVQLGLPGEGER